MSRRLPTPCEVTRWWFDTIGLLIERGVRSIIVSMQETDEDKQAMIDMMDAINEARGHPPT